MPIKILIGGLHRAYNRASASALYFWHLMTMTAKLKSHLAGTVPTYNRLCPQKIFFSRNIVPTILDYKPPNSGLILSMLFYWLLLVIYHERNKINIWLRSLLPFSMPILPFSAEKLRKLPISAVIPNTYFLRLIMSMCDKQLLVICPHTKHGKNQTLLVFSINSMGYLSGLDNLRH